MTGLTYSVLAEANAAQHVSWFTEWLAKQQHYSPQPYEQLAGTLRKAGYGDKAKEILYASKARGHSEAGGLSWVWLTLQWMFIGYGYYNFVALLWMLGLWLVGMSVLNLSKPVQSDINLHYWGCAYSLNMLLPIIELRKKHNDIDLNGWVRVYFYFHRIMGYVLTFFLVAGLSGLTK